MISTSKKSGIAGIGFNLAVLGVYCFTLLVSSPCAASVKDTSLVAGSNKYEEKYYASNQSEQNTSESAEPSANRSVLRREKEYYKDGQLKIDRAKRNGKLEGSYRTYYKNGQPQCVCNYRDGKRDSIQMVHHDNGNLFATVLYKDGKPSEVINMFDRDGLHLEKGTLKNGYGTMYIYTEAGELEMISHYKKGRVVRRELKNKKALFR